MNISTTININKDILEEITFSSDITGKSRTEMIILLLKKVMSDNKIKARINCSVKYQTCDEKDKWHRFHVSFKVADYECFLDLKKVFKMSVSCLVAFATKKYLKQLLKEILEGSHTDNYPYQNYVLAKSICNGVIFWQFFWGIPQDLKEHLKYIVS